MSLSPLLRLTEFGAPTVRLAIVGEMSIRTGLLVALVTVALAEVEFGAVLGVQLLALLQRSEKLPFQVWASTPLGQLIMSPDRSNAGERSTRSCHELPLHDPLAIVACLSLLLSERR